MKNSPWTDIVQMQRKLYKRNQRFIEQSVRVEEPEFNRYRSAYQRATKSYRSISNYEALLKAVMKSDVIIVGDYHTCGQSQRSFLRVLKATAKKTRDFAVGLELLNGNHQRELDKFLSKRIGEKTFLKRIKLEEHWVFDLWPNFKPIFDFCRYHRISMKAMDVADVGSTVWERDEATGKLAAKILVNEGKKLFILIGDLHLAPGHLPKCIKNAAKELGKDAKVLILYENCDNIYWDLAKKGLAAEVEVVKVDDDSFCRLHTPPVLCQQSYINWLEHEEGEIDYADARHSFLELVDRLCKFMHIRLGNKKENIEVYTCGDLDFIHKLEADKKFEPFEIEIIKHQILSSESYFIAKAGIVYLGNLSLNHAAEEASHFIKHLCSGEEKPRHLIDAYYANVLHEMLGFFGAKVINHQRKCSHWSEVEALVEYFSMIDVPASRRLEAETAILSLDIREREKINLPIMEEMIAGRSDLLFALSHLFGYMLGDRLYYALLKGVITRKEVKQLYYDRWEGEGTPYAVYMRLSKRLRKVRLPKRI